jgi:hypothetical protein
LPGPFACPACLDRRKHVLAVILGVWLYSNMRAGLRAARVAAGER